jgi:hypothetical protein
MLDVLDAHLFAGLWLLIGCLRRFFCFFGGACGACEIGIVFCLLGHVRLCCGCLMLFLCVDGWTHGLESAETVVRALNYVRRTFFLVDCSALYVLSALVV